MCLIKNTHQNIKRLISFTRIEVETRTMRHSGNQFDGLKSTDAEFYLKFLYYKVSLLLIFYCVCFKMEWLLGQYVFS